MQPEPMTAILDPADYGNSAQEFELLCTSAGLVTEHDCEWLTVSGPDAGDFLHRMLTRSIRDQQLHTTRHAWLLDSGGKIISVLSVVHYAEQHYALAVRKGFAETVFAALDRYVIMEDLQLERQPDWSAIALEGQQFAAPQMPDSKAMHTMQRTYSGAPGLTYFGPAEQIDQWQQYLQAQGLKQVGYHALDCMRLLTKTPAFISDMQPQTNPLIYGNEIGYIDHGKGCYIGQETIAMTRDRGRPPSRLVQLEGRHAPTSDKGIFHQDKQVGQLCSSAFNAQTNTYLAFAIIKHRALENDCDTFYDAQNRAWQVRYITRYKAD